MRVLFLLILLCIAVLSFSQKHLLFDSANISVRSFSKDELKEFKNNKDFQYERSQQPEQNAWTRFWRWVWWKVLEIMSTKTGRGTVYTSLIVVAVVTLVFFVMQVMGMNKSGVISRKNPGNHPYTFYTEDIHTISFEDAIKAAVESRNFRLAIRLMYLQSLKQLADKGHIEWHINKTNAEFVKEVANKPWHSLFKKLTYSFECSWYGDINPGDEAFQRLNAQFQQFNNLLL